MRSGTKPFGLVTAAIVCLVTFGFTNEARAGLISCPLAFTTDGTANVTTGTSANATAASLCEYLVPPNPSAIADVTTVNAAGFFGVTNWTVAVPKYDVPNGGGQSGTWSIPTANFSSFQYMITFKDGAGTNLVSFLLNGLSSSGNWYSPFSNPPFAVNQTKDVSHFTIFQTASRQVDEPTTLAIMGVGLFGFALACRRRQKIA